MSSAPQNLLFDAQNHSEITWCCVTSNRYPHQRVTACCGKKLRIGDIAVTIPAIANGELRGTALVHRRCLAAFLVDVPTEQEIVNAEWQRIREIHAAKSSTSAG